jgi:polar amino acid transport system substrate-binding protein
MTKGLGTAGIGRRGLTITASFLPAMRLIGSARADTGAETTFDRVRRAKTLRVAVLPGELPYFQKDPATGDWSGAAISMAQDVAKVFDAKVSYLESASYANSVSDLQSNKIDLSFALNPTPARALLIGFSHPMIFHPFGCLAKKDLAPKTWDDLNKPELTIVFDTGGLHETFARRYCAKANLVGYRTRDECTQALQAGRADAHIQAALLGLSTIGKFPDMGPYHLLTDPTVALPSCLGIQRESDTRFREVVDAWLDMVRGTGQLREWMLQGLALSHVGRDQVPPGLTF